MARILLLVFFSFFALTTVSGCASSGAATQDDGGGGDDGGGDDGGGDGGGDPPDPPVSLLHSVSAAAANDYTTVYLPAANAELDRETITDLATDFASLPMPASGSLEYSGYIRIGLSNANGSARVIGEMEMSIDLGTSAISGGADNFMGTTEDEADVLKVVSYLGGANITSGSISGNADGDAAVLFDMEGDLDSGLNKFHIETSLEGFVHGDDATELYAIGLINGRKGSFTGNVDGDPLDTGFAVVSVNRD